ncbi:TlpA family protein disulfide reductase [uncultured Winogradskyella sp.]|uniref:TlpA family protein disulfide reductase n=1 Tax=uncultured Winogradskyella sp. TaxID=395353 RepID=UPI0035193356
MNKLTLLKGIGTAILMMGTLLKCKDVEKKFKDSNSNFEVIINTNPDIDSLSMYPSMVPKTFLDTTYPSLFKGQLKNGAVTFTASKLPHPYMFDIYVDGKGLSDKFYVDNGTTEVFLDFENKSNIEIPMEFKSKTQIEYEDLKDFGLNEIDSLRKKAKTAKERSYLWIKRDSVIVEYLQKNPNSYVPLWLMVNYVAMGNNRYNQLYDESLHLFSDEIKKTRLYKNLALFIKDTRENTISDKLLKLKNLELKPVDLRISDFKHNGYILLDFWYSNCAPCLAEMPEYIPLYEKYKDKGFEIVSISVDKTDRIPNWKQVIEEKNFGWTHYLDENRREAHKLYILAYPTTFLIDSDGKVVEKDISIEKLSRLLETRFME